MSKKEAESVGFWLPSQCTVKLDVMTPHKLAVVFLIREYMKLKKSTEKEATDFGAADRKRFCMLLLKLIQYPDMQYKDLHGLLTSPVYGLHRLHLETFEALMNLIKKLGIEMLFDLYSTIDKLITDHTASFQIGIVGLYLRKVFVMLDRMSFPEFMTLYENVVAYYEKGIRAMEVSSSSLSNSESFMKLENEGMYKDRNQTCKWSMKQSELFIAQQSALLQNNEIKALTPKELQMRLDEIIRDHPLYSQAYFLSYMNSVRVRDYFSAVDTLHRSFDRSPAGGTTFVPENKEYQYSSLNLAMLHAQFNHTDEALSSLRECIMLAQESSDKICLQLAQSWLCLLDPSRVQITEKTIPTKELITMAHTISLGIQTLVKSSALNGYTPAKLFEVLMKSDILNCQTSMMDLTANGIAERSALWAMYGKHEISSLCAQLLLNSDLKSLGKTYNGEGICQSMCSMIVWMALQGEYNLALVGLKHAKERFPRYPLSKAWLVADSYITSIRAIHRLKWTEANDACNRLYTLDENLSLLQFAWVALARLDMIGSCTLLEDLLSNENIEPLHRVRALLLMANVEIYSEQMEVLDVLGEALLIANNNHLDYEKGIIDMHYAYVLLLMMKLPQQAFKSVKTALENILANGSIYDKARVQFLFVRCSVALESTTEGKISKLEKCQKMLDQAVEFFKKLECHTKVKDVYIYLAKTYNDLEQFELRNRYSLYFRQTEEEFPTPREYLDLFF